MISRKETIVAAWFVARGAIGTAGVISECGPEGPNLLGMGKQDLARCEEEEGRFKRFAAVLDGALAGKRFLVNDQLTLADFCVAAPLSHAAQAELPIAGFRNVNRWLAALDEQPGVGRQHSATHVVAALELWRQALAWPAA